MHDQSATRHGERLLSAEGVKEIHKPHKPMGDGFMLVIYGSWYFKYVL